MVLYHKTQVLENVARAIFHWVTHREPVAGKPV